jgi:hypothetical protein
MKKVKITGVSNTARLEGYIDSNMIDIMYVDENDGNDLILLLENEVNIDNPNDKKWILELINQALFKCEEHNAKIIFS